MKKSSLQGYVMALSFINQYEEDDSAGLHTLSVEHKKIQFELSKMVSVWVNKGHNINKEITIAWKYFQDTVGSEYVVSALPFAFHLVLKNPTINKYKKLKALTLEQSKVFMFKKEEEIRQSKELVNKFYGLTQ